LIGKILDEYDKENRDWNKWGSSRHLY
jgi:hypothetical protein